MAFRWIAYSEEQPAYNMAVDEAILEAHRQGLTPPTVRFYGWKPSAVSIGYAQKLSAETVERILSGGFEIVRRSTGGRAVLHHADLTYSFVGSSQVASTMPPSEGPIDPNALASSVSASYWQICQGLLRGLEKLGVHADLGRGKGYTGFQDCFMSTTNADLQVDDLKLIGSAQLRRQNAVLQHGSILLNQEQDALPKLLKGHDASSGEVGERPPRHRNLCELTGVVPISKIEDALVQGFAQAFGQELARGELTDYERELANKLRKKFDFLEPVGAADQILERQ